MPEDRRIFTDLTVDENLEVGRQDGSGAIVALDARAAVRALPQPRRDARAARAEQMSGGEQQMLDIARTLMGNPDAILLDEPSEGMAPVIVQMMAEAILAMKAEGIAVLLSEQNWSFAAAISDRACVIERGEMRFQGSMAEFWPTRRCGPKPWGSDTTEPSASTQQLEP